MTSKKRMILGAAALLVIAVVSVVIALWPDPKLLTGKELFEALSKELGSDHIASVPSASMYGIDAFIYHDEWLKVNVNLTDRGVTPTTLRLISRTPEVRELSLSIRNPLDDKELRLLGKMRHLEFCQLYASSRMVVGLNELERLQRLSTLRSLGLELHLGDMNVEVVAALAKIKTLRHLMVYLPADFEEQEAREAFGELQAELSDCIIYYILWKNFHIMSETPRSDQPHRSGHFHPDYSPRA